MIVANTVATVPTSTDRLVGRIAARRLRLPIVTKPAVTVVLPLSVSVQLAVPLHPPPDQPVKFEPLAAAALKVICVPVSKLAVHVLPQLIPDGVLVTVPVPLPDWVTDSMLVAGFCVKIAVTVVSAASVT
jgi:hypothetical protein